VRFLADERCDAGLVAALRSDGHDVLYAVETLRGATDDTLLERAFIERRLLVTEDKDFGELAYRLRRPACGVLLLRFDVADRGSKVSRLRDFIVQAAGRMVGAFTVLEVDKARVRQLR
jgi:predicted nuclease of predicted toxin-antitoxin system